MDPRISSAFASGLLLRPDASQPDLVHLARAVAIVAGVGRFDATPPIRRVLDCIGEPRHLVFVLLDGLGLNLLARLPADAFLLTNLRLRLRATSPSTTACALTSVATGTWPSEHGVTGWFTHVPTRGLTVTTLHMAERFSGEPIAQRNIAVDELLPVPAFHREFSAAPFTLLPAAIADTPFARYSRGDTAFHGYANLLDAFERIHEFVRSASGSTYTHLYVPDIDSACHHYGLHDEHTTTLLLELDRLMAQLSRSLPEDARLVITADHGLVDVPPNGHLPLTGEDALMNLLEAPPSGDGRMPLFHVRAGARAEFSRGFREHFGDGFALMDAGEAEQLGLFGPGRMSEVSRQRFGDAVGIALGPVLLHYEPYRSPPPQHVYLAQHAGLTPDELLIPLIVA